MKSHQGCFRQSCNMCPKSDDCDGYLSTVKPEEKCQTIEEREAILADMDYKRFKTLMEARCDNG